MRNNIICTIATPQIKELATKLGMNISIVNNLVSTWQSENKTTDIPTVEQAKERLQQSKNEIEEFYLALPNYEVKPQSPDGRMAATHRNDDGSHTIYLYQFEGDYLTHFFEYIYGRLEGPTSEQKKAVMTALAREGYTEDYLRQIITSPDDAKNVLLWHEMSHIEFNHREGYYTAEEEAQIAAGDNSKVNWLDKTKVDRETAATLQAFQKMKALFIQRGGKVTSEKLSSGGTIGAINDYIEASKDHITFDKATHTYFIDGKPADYSVTQYIESIYGKKDIQGDYSHSVAIGNSIDAISRDFFDKGIEAVNRNSYPNINESRKNIVVNSLVRLAGYLDNRFGKGTYRVVTSEFPIVASIDTSAGTKTIAGTMDMMVIDKDGNIHIFDFKAKNHPINQTYNGVQSTDARDYTAQQNMYKAILESVNPSLRGKVKSIQLIWFDTDYPKLKEAQYKTDENGNVTVTEIGSDTKDVPLSVYAKFKTPTLKPNITESIISLHINNKVAGLEIPQMNSLGLQKIEKKEGEEKGNNPSNSASRPQAVFGADLVGAEQAPSVAKEVKVPEVGVEKLHVNKESIAAKLARDFTPLERTMRVELLARTFSRKVDEATQKLSDDIKEQLSHTNDLAEQQALQTKLVSITDPENGRKNTIQEYTPVRIFNEMRGEFEGVLAMTEEEAKEEYGEEEGPRMLEAARKILDNFYPLLNEACTLIEGWEDVRIVVEQHDYHDGENTTQVEDAIVDDSVAVTERIEDETDDDTEGERVNGSEGWSFKVRYVDPHTTISKKVKRILSDIALEGVNGLEYDDLGNLRYLNAQTAYMAIMDSLSTMVDADDFSVKNEDGTWSFPALEKMRGKHPWIGQVIDTLQTDPSLISSFFTAFRKDFIPYWMQYLDEGSQTWRTYAMNAPVALDSSMTDVNRNYEIGIKLDEDSLYGTGGSVNKDNAAVGAELAKALVLYTQDYGESDYEDISNKLAKGLRMIGFNVTPANVVAMLETEDGFNDFNKVVNALRSIFASVTDGTLKEGEHLITENNESFKTIASIIGQVSDLSNVSSVRQGDKTLYSYSAPNYINTLVKQLKNEDRYERFLEDQFGRYSWFREGGKWRSGWLTELESSRETRHQLELKELKYLGQKEYEEWTPSDIKTHFLMEYYSVPSNRSTVKQYAWYNFPIFSDSPVAMFIKFTKESGEGYQDRLIANMREVVLQELSRIKLVRERRQKIANGEISAISNFDKNGDRFHFFPELNMDNGTFLAQAEELADAGDTAGLNALIDSALRDIMEDNFNKFYDGLSATDLNDIEKYLTIEGIITGKEEVRGAIEEYYWNQTYASSQIIELTTTDLAFYKNGTDFQKRYKEVYAAGDKLNTNSQYGRKIEKTIYISDQIVTSSSFTDIKASLDRAVELGHIQDYDRDNILNKFRDINVADAQAFRSPSSFRAVMDMLGKWDDKMQKAMDNFESGNWDMEDFNIVWQTIKPFVYSQIPKPDGFGSTIKVPHQNKNSEFLLLSLYQAIAGPIGQSPKLQAITEFMEKNSIDVVQFESAVKSGCQGVIDINYSEAALDKWKAKNPEVWKEIEKAAEKAGSKKDNLSIFKTGNDYLLQNGKITQDVYNSRFKAIEPSKEEVLKTLNDSILKDGIENPEVVHSIPYEDYVVQQPTPEHIFDAEAVFGSQFRNLIVADLPSDFTMNLGKKTLNKEQLLHLYQSTIVENLLEDYTKLRGKFATIEDFQQEMLRQIKGNPKYGRDMINAMEIVEVINPITNRPSKVFNIPMNNPSTTSKLQELVMSMFKNGITKQHINGGACIMVSDFGLTDKLKVVYNKEGDKSSGIKGIECYLPAYSKKFYEALMKTDENGNQYLDINDLPEDLRRAVGYRIPTEDKYSMAPLIIKGFLPQQNGSSIMLPADITTLAGSDFDVDKMYLMLPAFRLQRYDMQAARRAFEKVDNSAMKALEIMFKSILGSQMTEDEKLELIASEENDFQKFFKEHKEEFRYDKPRVVKVKYDTQRAMTDQDYLEHLSRDARNNMLIDIAYGILSHPDTAEKINNPGSFDKLKVAARIANIVSNYEMIEAFAGEYGLFKQVNEELEIDTKGVVNKLLEMSEKGDLDALTKFVEKYSSDRNSLIPDTFVYNHRQNMTGAALIGMYANNTTMQAKFQYTNLNIADKYSFVINGVKIGGRASNPSEKVTSLHDVDSPLGGRISKMCANFSAASVDNVKDPVLASIMQNTNTANIAAALIRAGVGIEEVGLLFSQPIIKQTIELTGGLSKRALRDAINSYTESLKALKTEAPDKKIARTINYTSEMLLENCINSWIPMSDTEAKEYLTSQINVGRLFLQAILPISDDLAELTRVSRADSPNGAIATSIAGAKMQTNRVQRLMDRKGTRDFALVGLEGVLDAKVNPKMSKAELREAFFKSKMPVLQAFYSLGIQFGTNAASEYFPQTNEYTDKLVTKILDNASLAVYQKDNGARLLNAFYDEAVRFGLSKTKLFGDEYNEDSSLRISFAEKRDYYLYDYPAKFLEAISSNPEVAEIPAIKKLEVINGSIQMRRSGRLTPASKEMIMNAFDQLLYMDGTITVTEDGKKVEKPVQQLAVDLFMYSFYKEGLKFGPNSYGYFMSTQFLTSFPEFIDALRTMHYDMRDGTYFDKYLDQFYANHCRECVPFIQATDALGKPLGTLMDKEHPETSRLSIESKYVYNPNGHIVLPDGTPARGSYERIMYANRLYRIVDETQGNVNYVTYEPMPMFNVESDGLRYDANKTALEMKDISTDETRKQKARSVNSKVAAQPSDGLMNAINDGFSLDGLDELFADGFEEELSALEEQFTIDEGQQQLDTPMCLPNK